ncbi:LysR family transcriptional regulator [Streptomyces sp. AV19]|uniref:LysR family transcriptional regulator n=1 Tax=Streptomyces sp. AV19 TaxID=2793068 RepID=UPI0018FEFA9D|nr:LysR family transcriptional regulator [Streptomyces sp. AV19]MBH1939198.1 LysR family transcriptional regulator [Streptomyces sp. AV19]MDG4536928.1 LysR family transcriptional regulator [Streptomyces sp. AV19]
MLEISALELLVAVARLGSLSKAADELGITQPAASARIRTMEQRVGVGLVERSPSGSRLTEAGALVTIWAAKVLEAAEALEAGIETLRTRRDTQLRITASLTVVEHLLPGWLSVLRRERPATAVSIIAENSRAVADRVLSGEADLGFIESATVPPGLDAVPVAEDQLVLVTAPNHPWARRRTPVRTAELARTPLIMRERGSGTRQVLYRALGARGKPCAPLLELPSTTAVRSAVLSGAGPAVVSALAVHDDLLARRLSAVRLQGADLTRTLRAVWPTGHRPSGPARALLAVARRQETTVTAVRR